MQDYLTRGGEPCVRALITWLEEGAKQESFDPSGKPQPGDPSPKEVIARQCVECHNAEGGDMSDVPYADSPAVEPRYELVSAVAAPEVKPVEAGTKTVYLPPVSTAKLVHITHAHILSIPVFTLIIAGLFLLTGARAWIKLFLAPLPMLATCVDFASWWLARSVEPFVYVIAAAGAVFGVALGLQILIILGSMWFGRRPAGAR
jgi:hypothetical protein